MTEASLIERDEKGITVKVKDEDISILNILQYEIAKEESVDVVGVAQRHYLIPEYEFRVSMKSKDEDPFNIIALAVRRSLDKVGAIKEEVSSKIINSNSNSNSNSSSSSI
ncbi:MAG: RpoL/Rpb11 RNA polymerase subunit family protein [Candidatus Nitrosocaldus sp.]